MYGTPVWAALAGWWLVLVARMTNVLSDCRCWCFIGLDDIQVCYPFIAPLAVSIRRRHYVDISSAWVFPAGRFIRPLSLVLPELRKIKHSLLKRLVELS